MKVPGLPVTWCNSAFGRLTGYSKAETEGRNCRFMQGSRTEPASLRAMVMAIRTAKSTTLHVTNYRKNGEEFVNVLTLAPLLDSSGEYRYSIGVLGDATKLSTEGESRDKLIAALPKAFPAAAQPKQYEASLSEVRHDLLRCGYDAVTSCYVMLRHVTPQQNLGEPLTTSPPCPLHLLPPSPHHQPHRLPPSPPHPFTPFPQVDSEAQREQYRKEMVKFTRLVWSLEWDTSLKQVLFQPVGLKAFGQWLQKEVRHSYVLLT